jgi:hypothetical protein
MSCPRSRCDFWPACKGLTPHLRTLVSLASLHIQATTRSLNTKVTPSPADIKSEADVTGHTSLPLLEMVILLSDGMTDKLLNLERLSNNSTQEATRLAFDSSTHQSGGSRKRSMSTTTPLEVRLRA